jgi:hypothetical protein
VLQGVSPLVGVEGLGKGHAASVAGPCTPAGQCWTTTSMRWNSLSSV